jgi:hypothetical protein
MTGNNIGKKAEALDPMSELSDFQYVCNTTNQAHNHTRTTKVIAEYAGRTISKNMKLLIKLGQEAIFTKPALQTSGPGTTSEPDGVPTRQDIEAYKIDQNQYVKDVKEYKKEKEKMFAIIFNQCTPEVKNRLENSGTVFETMETNDDVKALVSTLEAMAFSHTGNENEYWTLQRSLRRLAGVQQGTNNDSLTKYLEQFQSYIKAVESLSGPLVPTKIDTSNTISDNSKRDKLLAALFLGGTDPIRY